MKVEIDARHAPAIDRAIAGGHYRSADALVDELLSNYETEQWALNHPEAVARLVAQAEATPLVDLSLRDLRDRMDAAINRAKA